MCQDHSRKLYWSDQAKPAQRFKMYEPNCTVHVVPPHLECLCDLLYGNRTWLILFLIVSSKSTACCQRRAVAEGSTSEPRTSAMLEQWRVEATAMCYTSVKKDIQPVDAHVKAPKSLLQITIHTHLIQGLKLILLIEDLLSLDWIHSNGFP